MKSFLLLLVSIFLIYTIDAQPVIPGLVANWKMNGNFNDVGGNAINGTNSGATATTNKASQANSAMAFSNPTAVVAQYASMPINAAINYSGTQNFSVSMLVYVNLPFAHTVGFFDNCLNYGGYGLWLWQVGIGYQLNFNYKFGNIGSNTVFPMGTWVHIAGVRNNGILSIYINGNFIISGPEGTTAPSYPFKSVFGTMFYAAQAQPNYNGHNGKLDEVSVYNRALSNAEIASLASFLLPLKLGDFSAVKKTSGTVLYWQTISETNTKSFVIERSADGSNFHTIGELNATGNSTQPVNYQFTDAAAQTSTVYYRLKMMDLDGTATLSRIVAVQLNRYAGQLKVYPNPVIDQVQFQWQGQEGKQVQVEILDLAGRIRLSRSLLLHDGTQTFSLPVTGFSTGLYTLRMNDGNAQQSTVFIKK